MEKGRVFTGARARLLIGGKKVGYARNCSGGESLEHQPVDALDNIETEENVPTRYRVRFSMGFVRVIGYTPKTEGWFPSLGQNAEQHLTNILTSGELTISIEDSQTGSVIMTLERAKATDSNWSIESGSMVGQDMEFVAIRMRDESEV